MDLARYEAMDAQRFDPMRSNKHPSNLAISPVMGQIFRRLSQPELPPHDVVGGIWSDHELVLVPLEVSSQRNSFGSVLAESLSSLSSPESPVSASTSTSSSSSYFTTPSPTAETETETGAHLNMSLASSPRSSPGSRQVDTFDRDDLIVTRTVIRPTAPRGMFSRPSSPPISRRPTPTSPLSRPNTPVFQALNCFRSGAFENEWDNVRTGATQPVLQVIVTQTREQYEQDLAFKEVVHEVCPEASGRRRAVH
ncbi:hypothetical protein JVU11DRAFT_7539 [Chiua virens]|nr:hypothetical protein JVU11DRAFT_7539 [Chiua virens]